MPEGESALLRMRLCEEPRSPEGGGAISRGPDPISRGPGREARSGEWGARSGDASPIRRALAAACGLSESGLGLRLLAVAAPPASPHASPHASAQASPPLRAPLCAPLRAPPDSAQVWGLVAAGTAVAGGGFARDAFALARALSAPSARGGAYAAMGPPAPS